MTRRARGKQLLADLAGIKARRAALLRERSDLDLKIAVLEAAEAEKFAEIAEVDVDLETGNKNRETRPAPLRTVAPDELARAAAADVAKLLGS
jgi:hypothetical protein